MSDPRPLAVVVLAAGEGTRMRSRTPKVLHTLAGRTLLGHVVTAARATNPHHLLVVVGHARAAVTTTLAELDPEAVPVVQEEQLGTGHAVRLALEQLPAGADGALLVVAGDTPLLRPETLAALLATHHTDGAATTMLTARLADPTGYGRVLRSAEGAVRAVVEHADADDETRKVDECATGVYVFAAGHLRQALNQLTADNAQREEYLPDVVGLHCQSGLRVSASTLADPVEGAGVNDRAQLAALGARLRDDIVRRHQLQGVAVLDPASTWIDADVVLEPDVTVHPGTLLHGRTVVRSGAVIGPATTLENTVVASDARVVRSHCVGAEVGPDARVGPFSYLRPGAKLGAGAKVGAYVEVKASELGPGAKVPHLSYVGDAVIGADSNIGAGTIFANYDGVAKHRTFVGREVRVGSNNSLVAPVELGDGSYTAAGSTITDDVPAGALGVARGRQRNVEGWVSRLRSSRKSSGGDTK